MDNDIKKDMKAMLMGAESMIKKMEVITKKAFADISPEQGQMFAKYLKDVKLGDKMKDIRKQTEDLKKAFRDAG